jgi:hypothetical protein
VVHFRALNTRAGFPVTLGDVAAVLAAEAVIFGRKARGGVLRALLQR